MHFTASARFPRALIARAAWRQPALVALAGTAHGRIPLDAGAIADPKESRTPSCTHGRGIDARGSGRSMVFTDPLQTKHACPIPSCAGTFPRAAPPPPQSPKGVRLDRFTWRSLSNGLPRREKSHVSRTPRWNICLCYFVCRPLSARQSAQHWRGAQFRAVRAGRGGAPTGLCLHPSGSANLSRCSSIFGVWYLTTHPGITLADLGQEAAACASPWF